jgi:ubiquinone/menaquinone biosynthesis C-methylase UbiE
MKAWWPRLVAFGFRLLYHELAWLYDPVSWIASLGRWRRWQRSIWPFLPAAGRVLEVGFGPGHLLADLAEGGYEPVGLDLSPAMLRRARRNLRRRRAPIPLCRGQAQALPFAPHTFNAVVVTFPTPFVYDPAWMAQLARVLKYGGRLIVVEMAQFTQRELHVRLVEWAFRVTGQRGPAPDLAGLLAAAGFRAWREQVEVEGTVVSLTLAEQGTAPPLEEIP